MRKMIMMTVMAALITTGGSFVYGGIHVSAAQRDLSEPVPMPVLTEPKGYDVYVEKGQDVIFKWSMHERARGFRDGFDFRLYMGTVCVESSLVYKMMTDPETYEIQIASSMFDDGEVYTVSLRQIYDGGSRKSRRAYMTFKVHKGQ